jgi:hypothetical protein
MKTQAYKLEKSRRGTHRGDAGSILVVIYIGTIIFFFLLGALSLI